MPERRKLGEVFKTVGLPRYTYVKPRHFGEVRADIEQPGKHLLIEGPSGIGKTCVVFKVFEELNYHKDVDFRYVSARDTDAEEQLERFLGIASRGEFPPEPILVVDDFHLLSSTIRNNVGATLKRLSDRAFEHSVPPKAILIGIPTTGAMLLADAYDLGPRLGSYRFLGASDNEIDKLLDEGESALNILFEDREFIISESSQNFWLAQFIANKICAIQDIHTEQDDAKIISFDLLAIRQRLMEELSNKYLATALTFAKGKKWRPGGNKPYLDVLFALAKNPDLVVTYDRIVNLVPERRRPGVKAVRPRIAGVIHDEVHKVDLRKQIAFDINSGFTVEDPLFRYYLTNMKEEDIYRSLGVERDNVERARTFTFDVGFSFAGESRRIVEIVNAQLKSEDILTFYDFDQQAVLLAQDLDPLLRKIYSESCAFYLVFMDSYYLDKVWTKYERDIMTHSGRSSHIIPVLLDDVAAQGVVGIPTTIGRIDLRIPWKDLQSLNEVPEELLNIVRNRCVIPVLNKLDDPFSQL